MKKFLTFILAFTMSITVLGTSGCSENDGSSNSSVSVQPVERLELEKSNLLLTLGDRVELSVSYNPLENEVLTWKSSDENVVSVDENGFLEGLQIGKATITASYGSKKASCEVEVSLSGNVPTLVFDDDVSEKISLMKGETFGLGAHIRFNGKEFFDAEIEYYVADETIGTIVNGEFVANNVTGSTQVNVFATWRGQTVHTKTIEIDVVTENTVLLNGGRVKEIKLYTVSQHAGVAYNTSQTISDVYISEDGVKIDKYNLSVQDEAIASIRREGNKWEITALKSGDTNLIVSYGNVEFPFTITVERPVFESNKKVEYSLADSQYLDEQSKTLKGIEQLFENFGEFVAYTIDGKEYKAKDGKLNISEGRDMIVTLYNQTVGYQISLDAYSLIIDELTDFEKIYAGDKKTTISGTYILAKDIVEPNTVLKMPDGKVANDFAGTFDGRGHVLSFTFEHGTTHSFGLFGEYLNGATIKNVALNNITMDGTSSKNAAGIICAQGAKDANLSPESTIENVFIDLKFSEARNNNFAFMGNVMWKTILKNVVIHVPEVPQGENYGAEGDAYGSFARGDTASVSNSYIISSAPTYDYIFIPNPNKPNATKVEFKKVPVLYATYNAMLSAGNDYSSFDVNYWDTTTYGVPAWKTLIEEHPLNEKKSNEESN